MNPIKGFLVKRLLQKAVSDFADGSMKGLKRSFSIASKVALSGRQREMMKDLRQKVQTGHPQLELIKRLSKGVNPNCRDRFLVNFFIGGMKCSEVRGRLHNQNNGFHIPFLLVISPSMRCNLRCKGCYAGDYSKKDGMSFDLMNRIITEAKELGIHFITISGGEPFLWPHLFDILNNHLDMAFQIYTNGTFIDARVANKLAEVGNAVPAISIEGAEEDTDRRRGKGVYQKIMNAMDNLNKKGVIFGFSATVGKYNVDDLTSEDFINKMIEKGASFGWYFMYVPVGKKPSVEAMMTPEQRDGLRKWVEYARNNKPIFIGDFWNDGPWVGGCISAGREYLHIIPNGDVEPCVFCHFAVDNIKEKSLCEILASSFFKFIQKKQPFNENHLRPCILVDNPQLLRDIVAETGAHPTHEGAEKLITTLASKVDRYTESYGKIADRVWKEEYLSDPVWKNRLKRWTLQFKEGKYD